MKTKTVFVNKWTVVIIGVLLFVIVAFLGAGAAYLFGKGLVYAIIVLGALWIFGLRINIR